jgi:hypothetical protein
MKVLDRAEFGTRECPSCGCEVAANHNHCPICGYRFPVATPRQRYLRLGGAMIMLGLILFLYLWRWL